MFFNGVRDGKGGRGRERIAIRAVFLAIRAVFFNGVYIYTSVQLYYMGPTKQKEEGRGK